MIIEESAHLPAPPERVVAFFEALDEHYLDWHPDHISFAWLDGARRQHFHFDERIGRWRIHMAMRVERAADGRRVTCRPLSRWIALVMPWMSFEISPVDGGSRYLHRIRLRLGPFAGLVRHSFLEPLRAHMAAEARYLGRL